MAGGRSFNEIPADVRIKIMAMAAERDRKAIALTCKSNLELFHSRKMYISLLKREMQTDVPFAVDPKDFYALRHEREQVITYLLAIHCSRVIAKDYKRQHEENPDKEKIKFIREFKILHTVGYNDEMLAGCYQMIEAAKKLVLVDDKRKELENLFDDIVISKAPDSWLRISTLIARDAALANGAKDADTDDLDVMSNLISAIGKFGALKTLKAFDAKKATIPGLQLPDFIIEKILYSALKFCQIDMVNYIYSQGISAKRQLPVGYKAGVFHVPQLSIACTGLQHHTRIAGDTNFVSSKVADEDIKLAGKIKEFRALFNLLMEMGADLDEHYEIRAEPLAAALAQHLFGANPDEVVQHLTPRECMKNALVMMQSTFHISDENKALLEEAMTFTPKVGLAANAQ